VSGGASRRGFFRELMRSAARAAEELGDAIRDAEPELTLPGYEEEEEYRVETVPAAPAARLASVEELRTLCAEGALAEHADAIAALAQTSLRLTGGYSGGSYLGGVPELPADFEWPSGFTCVASLQLDRLPETDLPRAGTLVVLAALPPASPAGRAILVDGPAEAVEDAPALPVLSVIASAELTLPALPPDGVDELAWAELRERLAAAQGVELEDMSADYRALHRVLGHPEALDPGLADEAGAPGFRLLFQLSGDERLGLDLGWERLTLWIRAADLQAGRFGRIRAFVR
jgi:hypothetical protein